MKRILTTALISSFAAHWAMAGAVAWGGAKFTNGTVYLGLPGEYGERNGSTLVWATIDDDNIDDIAHHFYLHGDFSVSSANGKTTIRGVNHVAAYSTTFVKMDIGETVDLLTTYYADEVFYAFGFRPGEEETSENYRYSGDYDIVVSSYGTQTFYLGFGVEGRCDGADTWLYGWLEVSVNGNELSVVNSAIGLNGQSMTVGVIPEPSAAMLLILGLAPMALRRRFAPCAPIV